MPANEAEMEEGEKVVLINLTSQFRGLGTKFYFHISDVITISEKRCTNTYFSRCLYLLLLFYWPWHVMRNSFRSIRFRLTASFISVVPTRKPYSPVLAVIMWSINNKDGIINTSKINKFPRPLSCKPPLTEAPQHCNCALKSHTRIAFHTNLPKPCNCACLWKTRRLWPSCKSPSFFSCLFLFFSFLFSAEFS